MENKFINRTLTWRIISILFIQIYLGNYCATCLESFRLFNPEIPGFDPTIPDDAKMILTNIHYWNFNIFELESKYPDSTLQCVAKTIFSALDFYGKFNLKMDIVDNFLSAIEENYLVPSPLFNQKNFFSTNIRAADITQTMFYFLRVSRLETVLNDVEIFSMILAAILMKYKHPGTNDEYESEKKTELFKKYAHSSRTVLEKFSIDEANKLFKDPSTNILAGFPPNDLSNILDIIDKVITNSAGTYHHDNQRELSGLLSIKSTYLFKSTIFSWILHVCDLSYTAKEWPVNLEWIKRRSLEYLRLLNHDSNEKKFDLTRFDEEQFEVAQSEIFFLREVTIPMFGILEGIFDKFFESE